MCRHCILCWAATFISTESYLNWTFWSFLCLVSYQSGHMYLTRVLALILHSLRFLTNLGTCTWPKCSNPPQSLVSYQSGNMYLTNVLALILHSLVSYQSGHMYLTRVLALILHGLWFLTNLDTCTWPECSNPPGSLVSYQAGHLCLPCHTHIFTLTGVDNYDYWRSTHPLLVSFIVIWSRKWTMFDHICVVMLGFEFQILTVNCWTFRFYSLMGRGPHFYPISTNTVGVFVINMMSVCQSASFILSADMGGGVLAASPSVWIAYKVQSSFGTTAILYTYQTYSGVLNQPIHQSDWYIIPVAILESLQILIIKKTKIA